jgi:guanylate kinase
MTAGSAFTPRTFPIILAAPSGAGKTSIARALKERRGDVVFSISATTRAPRPGEVDGRDYWFLTGGEFERWVEEGRMLEWAEVHGHRYGTPRRNLDEAVARGDYLLLDIDVQGSKSVRASVPGAVSVFVLPPSGTALAERLAGRGSEDEAVRRRRLGNADREIEMAGQFDYVIVNDRLDEAVDRLESILIAESLRTTRLDALEAGTDRLRAEIREAARTGSGSRTPEEKPT